MKGWRLAWLAPVLLPSLVIFWGLLPEHENIFFVKSSFLGPSTLSWPGSHSPVTTPSWISLLFVVVVFLKNGIRLRSASFFSIWQICFEKSAFVLNIFRDIEEHVCRRFDPNATGRKKPRRNRLAPFGYLRDIRDGVGWGCTIYNFQQIAPLGISWPFSRQVHPRDEERCVRPDGSYALLLLAYILHHPRVCIWWWPNQFGARVAGVYIMA